MSQPTSEYYRASSDVFNIIPGVGIHSVISLKYMQCYGIKEYVFDDKINIEQEYKTPPTVILVMNLIVCTS
jgi:hypothetical protein